MSRDKKDNGIYNSILFMHNSNYKKIEDSILSNPETIYVDDNRIKNLKSVSDTDIMTKNNIITKNKFIVKKNSNIVVIDNYIDNKEQYNDAQLNIENNDDILVPLIPIENSTIDIIPIENSTIDIIPIENSTIDIIPIENSTNEVNISDGLKQSNVYFDCYNEETSVNNVIDCSTDSMSASSVFENDFINNSQPDPFSIYDENNKQKDKIGKLGMVTLSAMIVLGSAYITKYMNN